MRNLRAWSARNARSRRKGLGMTSRVTAVGARRERGRWLLYVAMAVAGAMLTFVGARAQQHASDDAKFRKLIDDYCAAWSTGNADAPAKFYAKDNGLVFYDLAPFSYHSWKEYHDGVQKEFFANMASGTLTAGKDLRVSRRGTMPGPRCRCISRRRPRTANRQRPTCAIPGYGRSAAQTGFWFTSISRLRSARETLRAARIGVSTHIEC